MIIEVKVYPGSKIAKIIQIDNKYKAYLKSLPKNNEANSELIDLIARHFDTPKISHTYRKRVKIASQSTQNQLATICG